MFPFPWRGALVILAILGSGILSQIGRRGIHPMPVVLRIAAVLGCVALAFFLLVAIRQLLFPLQLEAMERTILQHVERLVAGAPVYPEPSSDFVALAYSPGLYVLAAPFVRLAGPSVVWIRLPAFLATLGLLALFGVAFARASRSIHWGVIGAVVPAAGSLSFDACLLAGHSDSLMILLSLLAAFLLPKKGRGADPWRDLAAAILLVVAFWCKQPAALIALGAGMFWILARGRRGWMPLGVMAILGPLAYGTFGPWAFGPDFLTSTYTVPASWSRWHLGAAVRFAGFVATWWGIAALVAGAAYLRALRNRTLLADPVLFLLPFAWATGLIGALDAGSSDNVFAASGAFTLLVCLRTIGPWLADPRSREHLAGLLVVTVTLALLAHDPRRWIPSRQAPASYADLVHTLESLDGPVYAPWIGNLPPMIATTARAHWVALEDRVRGSGSTPPSDPRVEEWLKPVVDAPPPAYLLLPSPLEKDVLLAWLGASYVLDTDYGERFASLRELPHRFGSRYPRYLYRRRSA